ncbi:hypothetical protein PGT21_001110 [Puccinia graminis f. sp. tritici]|uniref:TM7S3/TM198-like domain-containing protein n=1 Tax=Puccinia graminis f. sp. tritici TaxID=56615 RepID=A0A5B0RT03_PUCGR|nr:hypothetical protein PGT21_001110 [Puccinia graminis f. sp. tritici]KAA1128003.1 hypothetical protein PGTUg99_007398 [Puccinia graminis f. sp. tritici]
MRPLEILQDVPPSGVLLGGTASSFTPHQLQRHVQSIQPTPLMMASRFGSITLAVLVLLTLLLHHQHRPAHSLTLLDSSSTRPHAHPSLLPRQLPASSSSSTDQPSPAPEQSTAAGGTSPSRLALSSLLFSIPTTILGLILLLLGRALPRFYSSVAFALAIAFPTWALSINLAGIAGITGRSYSQDSQNIIIWALVSGTFFFGLSLSLLIGQHGYPIALFLLSIQAGLAISISILIFSNGLTIHHTLSRSIFLAIGPSISGLITIICRPSISSSTACAFSGAFLLFLGIDLLVNENDGMSRGIRFLFDHNPHHAQDLANFNPPTSTRILLPVSWACMFLGAWYQYRFLDRPFHTTWPADLHRKSTKSSAQSTVLVDRDIEKNGSVEKVEGLTAVSASSQEDHSSSPAYFEDPPFPASPQPQEFESPSQSEQRYTTDSYDTGLSAIPELTEHSTSGRGGSRSGSGSGRALSVMFPHSHRHPSNATSNSIRRSTRSSEFQIPPTALPSTSEAADPSNISVSPPHTTLSETTVFPDDSISQTTRQRLALTIYSNSGLIEEETEAMLTLATDAASPVIETKTQEDDGHRADSSSQTGPDPFMAQPPTPGSTGVLTRLARAFGEGSSSVSRQDLQLTPQNVTCGEEASEEQALQSDAERWASLSDGQSPYEHTARLRRDLHSWTSDEPT